jgi:hypothetical protein
MSTITAAANYPVAAPFNTSPAYSGTFIPAVWSAKLNAKFYAASVFGEISNTDWEGEISSMGDKVIINTAPTLTVSDYVVGTPLLYQVPTPDTTELNIDKGKYFAFQIADVLEYQAKPALMDMFSTDAGEQMRIAMDSTILYNTFGTASNVAVANKGSTAGRNSGAYDLGTEGTPVALTKDNVLQKILELASVLDEQNVPESDRWLLIDPFTRSLLLQSSLAQAQWMGDSVSGVRNGKIGGIDRFAVYVTNQLPYMAASGTNWVSAVGNETSVTGTTNASKRRMIRAGHKSAITFASQITKMETVRNPNDFGDFIRSLNVYGYKTVKPDAQAVLIAK